MSHGHVVAGHRSFQCNWGKRGQRRFCLTIEPFLQPTGSPPSIPQNDEKAVIRPYVRLAESQYERLNELREKRGKSVSEMIREAVSRFVKKRDHPVGMVSSYLPKA